MGKTFALPPFKGGYRGVYLKLPSPKDFFRSPYLADFSTKTYKKFSNLIIVLIT